MKLHHYSEDARRLDLALAYVAALPPNGPLFSTLLGKAVQVDIRLTLG